MERQKTYSGPFSFFRKHFDGEYSLGRSYWVNTFLIQLFAPLLGVLLLPWLSENYAARYTSSAVIFLTVLGIVAWAWAVSGTWASANKHVGRGGKQGWATVAKAMIVMGVLRMIGEIGGMSESLTQHWKVATGWQLGPDVSLQVRADGKSILLKGGINDGTAESLAKALELAPSVTTVVLQSTGGWVRQGKLIAKIISERRLNTYVEQECSSACTIAFLAGKERSVEPTARIGFHSFKSIGAANAQAEEADTTGAQEVYRRAGLSPAFIAKVVETPSDKMWYPSHEELLIEGVLSRTSLGGETATLATSISSKEMLSAEFMKTSVFNALAAKYPNDFKELVDKAWIQVQARRTDTEVMAAARAEVSRIASKLLPTVSDKTLIDFNLLVAAQAEAIGKRSAEACVELIFPTGEAINTSPLLPGDLVERELQLMSEMISTSDPGNARHFSKKEVDIFIQRVFSQLSPEEVQFLASEKRRASSPVDACKTVVAYLNAMNNTPISDRANSLRAIYSSN